MPFVELTEEHHVGVSMIDDQHMRLAEMINKLYDSMQSGIDTEEVRVLINAVVGYIEYHFDEEEQYMLRTNYPEAGEHKRMHISLRKQIQEIKRGLDIDRGAMPLSILDFLRNWLLNHIQTWDVKLGQTVKSRVPV